jgi:hypothetical protein
MIFLSKQHRILFNALGVPGAFFYHLLLNSKTEKARSEIKACCTEAISEQVQEMGRINSHHGMTRATKPVP